MSRLAIDVLRKEAGNRLEKARYFRRGVVFGDGTTVASSKAELKRADAYEAEAEELIRAAVRLEEGT